jgi:methylthioribose-1-phosphate isomerase
VIKLAPVDGHDPEIERLDLTPPHLIDAVVTEEGAFAPDEIASLVDRTPFLRDGYVLLRAASSR